MLIFLKIPAAKRAIDMMFVILVHFLQSIIDLYRIMRQVNRNSKEIGGTTGFSVRIQSKLERLAGRSPDCNCFIWVYHTYTICMHVVVERVLHTSDCIRKKKQRGYLVPELNICMLLKWNCRLLRLSANPRPIKQCRCVAKCHQHSPLTHAWKHVKS